MTPATRQAYDVITLVITGYPLCLRSRLLPKEALGKLNAERGDTLYLVEGPEGYTLTVYDPEFEEQVTAARGIMKRYKNALKELAK